MDGYVEATKKLPPRDVRLETKDNTYFHFKTDIFKREITYSTDKQIAANLVTLTAERVFEVIALNKNGVRPEKLLPDDNQREKEISAYGDIIGQDSVSRFDKKKKKRRDNNRGERDRQGGRAQRGDEEQRQQGGGGNRERRGNRRGNDNNNRGGKPNREPQGEEMREQLPQHQGERQGRGGEQNRNNNRRRNGNNRGGNGKNREAQGNDHRQENKEEK